MEVIDSAAMRSAKMAGGILLPHSSATDVRRGKSRATHVSTIIHLKENSHAGDKSGLYLSKLAWGTLHTLEPDLRVSLLLVCAVVCCVV